MFQPIFRTRMMPVFFTYMCTAWGTAVKGGLEPMLGVVMQVPALVHLTQRRTGNWQGSSFLCSAMPKHGLEVLSFCYRLAESQQSAHTARLTGPSLVFRDEAQLENCFGLGAGPFEHHSPPLNKQNGKIGIREHRGWPGRGVVIHNITCLVSHL